MNCHYCGHYIGSRKAIMRNGRPFCCSACVGYFEDRKKANLKNGLTRAGFVVKEKKAPKPEKGFIFTGYD